MFLSQLAQLSASIRLQIVVPLAKSNGAQIVIVNAEATEMDAIADVVLRGSIGDILPQLFAQGGNT